MTLFKTILLLSSNIFKLSFTTNRSISTLCLYFRSRRDFVEWLILSSY